MHTFGLILTQYLTFRCEVLNTAPKLTCRNRERCIQLCRGISHAWYRATNHSRSITRSIISKKNVRTNSNGDKLVSLVTRTQRASPTCEKSFLAPISLEPYSSLPTTSTTLTSPPIPPSIHRSESASRIQRNNT